MTIQMVRSRTANLKLRIAFDTALILISILVLVFFAYNSEEEPKNPYNFVDLQVRFKHYTVVNKYQETDKDYVLCLVNPVTGDEYKAYVTDVMYVNVYFVGDTIK